MSHGLLWLPLLAAFVLLAALGWLERRRQNLFRDWAEGAELAKLDGCGGARLRFFCRRVPNETVTVACGLSVALPLRVHK